jgi:predicted membrane channel-forming protein YqfA (hemolysin III family)
MRLDVDVAGAAATLPCRLVLIASEAVLILAALAVNADEPARLCNHPTRFSFCPPISFMVYAAVAFLLFLVDLLWWHAMMLFLLAMGAWISFFDYSLERVLARGTNLTIEIA